MIQEGILRPQRDPALPDEIRQYRPCVQPYTFPSSTSRGKRALDAARASTWTLLGGLTLMAALSAYGVEVYAESATVCGGLVQRGSSTVDSFCSESLYGERQRLVVGLGASGFLLLAFAGWLLLRARRHGAERQPVAQISWTPFLAQSVALSLLIPFAHLIFFVLAMAFADPGMATSTGLPAGWRHIGLALGVTAACLFMGTQNLTERSVLAAAGMAVPVSLAMQVGLGHPVAGFTIDSTSRITSPAVWLTAVPLVVAAMSLAGYLQERGWRGPVPWLSVLSVLASTAAVTVVLMPQLLPAYREARGGGPYPRGGPGPEIWLPMTVGAALACVLAIAYGYRAAGNRARGRIE